MASLAGACRNIGTPVALFATLPPVHFHSFNEPNIMNAIALLSFTSKTKSFACEFSNPEAAHTASASSALSKDKPAGTSVGGTTNNIVETCVTFTSRALELATPLKITHQIDNCTEGCVVLAKTKEFCSHFHGKIRDKEVTKLYLALSASPVPNGMITHYMFPDSIPPKIVSEEFRKGWHLCQLEILECKKVPWPNAATIEKYSIEDFKWPSKDYAYECKINLLTGRTHQIRAQLAACGAPIVGDSMYMPAAIAEIVNPGVNPFGKYRKEYTSEDDESMAILDWIEQHGKEPKVAIGLQACQISWDNGNHIYRAGPPWWRDASESP